MELARAIDLDTCPIGDADYIARCKAELDEQGSLLINNFVRPEVIADLKREAEEHASQAYYCVQTHTAYLSPPDPEFPSDHPRNRQEVSTKGCITDDQVPEGSWLRVIYESPEFRGFLCAVLGETDIYNYADPLSSINVHYYEPGNKLGWHFDNSSFAVTLMIEAPESGGVFEYIPALRDHAAGNMNFEGVGQALDGNTPGIALNIRPGTLALFRGRNSLHRVTPTVGETQRIQVVLAYNTEPGFSLSEQARLTFYGRTH